MILAFPDERFNTNSKNTTFYRFVSGSPNGEPFFGILFASIYKQIQIFYFKGGKSMKKIDLLNLKGEKVNELKLNEENKKI